MVQCRVLLIVGIISGYSVSAAATAECYFQDVQNKTILESVNRQAILGKRIKDAGERLQALLAKAPGPAPVGQQLSLEDRKFFDALSNNMTASQLKLLVESARERDVAIIFGLAKVAERYHLKQLPARTDEEASYQNILLGLEASLGAETIVTPKQSTFCNIDSVLAAMQSEVETLRGEAGPSVQFDKNVSDYVIAIELVRKMNRVSELIYKLDSSDADRAARVEGRAFEQAWGKSVREVLDKHRVSDETALMIKIWRRIDEQYPSLMVKSLTPKPAEQGR